MRAFVIMHNVEPVKIFVGSARKAQEIMEDLELKSYTENMDWYKNLSDYRNRNLWVVRHIDVEYSFKP